MVGWLQVLLVEDSVAYSTYIRVGLAATGEPFEFSHAGNVSEAIDRLAAGGIDVILLDLGLPDSSGLETLHRVHRAAGDVPIVVLSALRDQALATAAVKAGAQDYLVKSDIEPQVLHRVIRYAIERRAADARLRERDAHYRAIVESSLDAIISMDHAGRVIDFNPAAEAMFRRSRAESMGQDLVDLIMPARMRERHRRGLARHLATGHATAIERRMELTGMRADGSEFPLELTIAQVVRAAGPSFTGFIRDLSERQRAEEAQRIGDERFRLLAGATNDAIWDWDIKTNQLQWSEGFEILFGFSRDEVEPTLDSWISRIHPGDSVRVLQMFWDSVRSGSRFVAEYRFLCKSGDYAFVLDRGQVIRDEAGTPVRMVGGMADLTERNQALSRIAEQASLLDRAQDAILVRDLDHRVTYYNKSAERIFGWTAEDVTGQSVRDRFFPDPEAFDRAMRDLQHDGDWQGELSVAARDGSKLTVESRWTLMRNAAGAPHAVLVIDTDITERKALEQRFLRAQRMESIGTLAGGIAHDLNNVLAPVLMSIELLKDNPTEEERILILATIEASTRRGGEMVRQVLSFARGVEGERTAVDIHLLLAEVDQIVKDTFVKSILVRTVAPDELPLVLGDATQLHQVLINLCVNARDAMPQGGALTLTAQPQQLDAKAVGLDAGSRPGPYVVIRVTDTGTGIPPQVLDRAFEPFFTSKPTGKGTGLGLSTSLAIVKSHGGFMRADSELGRGSTFTVYLPAQAGRATPALSPASPARARGAGELVLVVDDEAPLLRMTSLVLESFGYRVLLAKNGAEAIALFAANRAEIKVVLTDMTMPVMDGATVIRKLREIDPDVRVIAASGLGATAASQVSGVLRFLPKPYTADTLLKAVTDVVRG